MNKVLKTILKVILIITILLVSLILISNIVTIVRIMFLGITVGNSELPDSIWWFQQTLKGTTGLKTYYSTIKDVIFTIELPILLVSIVYQVIYFKYLKKR